MLDSVLNTKSHLLSASDMFMKELDQVEVVFAGAIVLGLLAYTAQQIPISGVETSL